ncbi:N-acetylmuramoyl-L-alanine amidase [Staphylococcus gallinarum]|uniref:N-acetylmuramoyl-L-alanine amidase n=1 Tax=Staphylococcus gallinarum TaxID=1293 RepID=UPI000E698084|nr:N-acetylmuramoyl-L-alanine amidase [Staphylococcus gallinarum]RIL24743.1 CHAP domain-containing protein [Staphylococcus gallinarum]RIO85688.1 CHAP domain-containing protein [Staphylococcus gallinarum]
MTVNKTKAQAHSYLVKLKGYWWDFDGAFGAQCFDLANMYWNYLTGGRLGGYYAKDIPFKNNFNGLATVYENTPSFLPQKGDIVVFNSNYGEGAGHVAIVWSANINSFVSLDQNWYGGAQYNPPEVAQLITHYYDNPMYFIRPHYKSTSSVIDNIKDKVSKPSNSKAKGKKILIAAGHGYNDPGAVGNGTNERDFIRKYIAPNIQKYLKQAGHTVDLYGGIKQDQNLFVDTQYGERLGDTKNYGMYWVKQQKYDVVVELHLDAAGVSATGGHVIISNQWPADSIDKNINNALKATVGTIRDIDPRNNLLNANVAGRLNVNYRLVEMGFITNKNDMKYLKKNYDKFSKELAGAINGKPITGTAAGRKQITWNWKGRFSPNTAIKVRRKPGLKGAIVDKGSWLYNKNDWVDFVSVTKKDGYWWIKFKYPTNPSAGYFYCAVCKIKDKKERIKHEKYWGSIKWK